MKQMIPNSQYSKNT